MKSIIINTVFLSFLFVSENVSAIFVNASFNDELSGWSAIGYVKPTSQWSSNGNYSVAILPKVSLSEIESELDLSGGALDVVSEALTPESTNTLIASIAYRTFSMSEGDRIDFSFDLYKNSNYSAVIFLEGMILSEYYTLSDLIQIKDSACGCYCKSGAGFFNASVSGDAIIGFMVISELNSINNLDTKLENVNAGISEVPVPAAAWLFISGLLYITLFVRKIRK